MIINDCSLSTIIKNKLIDLITKKKKQLQYFTDFLKVDFSIDLSKNEDKIIYKSSLCLRLAKICQKSPLFLAQNIADIFNQYDTQQDIFVLVSGNGWLEFIIGDRLLNLWLNKVNKSNFLEVNKLATKLDKSQVNFNNYYINSRCCSILKSAHLQNIITLNNVDFNLNQWYIEKPVKIRYEIINLSGSYEQKLIKELIIITEKIVKNKLNCQTSLNSLGKIILEVEFYCRIWGEIRVKNLEISIARLGLIAVALHFYQNLFYAQFNDNLPVTI
jgi:Arginyl tRNA synthetase N terminal domain